MEEKVERIWRHQKQAPVKEILTPLPAALPINTVEDLKILNTFCLANRSSAVSTLNN